MANALIEHTFAENRPMINSLSIHQLRKVVSVGWDLLKNILQYYIEYSSTLTNYRHIEAGIWNENR